MDTTHLVALQTRLANEQKRLAAAKTAKEKSMREVWVKGIENEIEDEFKFLGLKSEVSEDVAALSDDELLDLLS